MEKKGGRLEMGLRTVTGEAKDKANLRIRPAWKAVQKQLGRETQISLRKTELQGRRFLKRIIESTIQGLEKLNRRLEQDLMTSGYAA